MGWGGGGWVSGDPRSCQLGVLESRYQGDFHPFLINSFFRELGGGGGGVSAAGRPPPPFSFQTIKTLLDITVRSPLLSNSLAA